MSQESFINVEIQSNVAVIYLNDPPARNALSEEMGRQLRNTLLTIHQSARAVVLTGTGEGFCSGAKLSKGGGDDSSPEGPDLGKPLRETYNPLMMCLRELNVPVITAVNGAAAGIGCSLALSGDIIVASDKAFFLQAFSRIGLAPDGGASYLTVKSIGRIRAMEMALLDERLTAEQALEWGLITRVVDAENLLTEAVKIAEKLASGPTKAYAAIRKQVWGACEFGYLDQLAAEANAQTGLGRTSDHSEGVRAFMSREKPNFTGS
jgi:2-(1,2-epoxy-1,2-dihydrophenyl)acetyl-CoA isomerase